MTALPMTTIKVPKDLRARISREAADSGVTAAAFIADLLDERERRARFQAVAQAYETADDSYADETAEWDELADDGLV